MPEFTNRIIANGQVTVPKEVREELGIEHGDSLHVYVEPVDSVFEGESITE